MAFAIRGAIDAVPPRLARDPHFDIDAYADVLASTFKLATSSPGPAGGAAPVAEPHAGPFEPAVAVGHLRVSYGSTVAVDDVSLSVYAGEIFGVLGPNGAGKTTTVECVIGLRVAGSGSIRVLGLDPIDDREQLRAVVGAQLQAAALPARLTSPAAPEPPPSPAASAGSRSSR